MNQQYKKELVLFLGALMIFICAYSLDRQNVPYTPYLYMLAFIVGGYEKAKEGIIQTIKQKNLNVEVLMILAALSAFIIKNYYEGSILILIFGLSGMLESYANSKSEKSLTSLLNLTPKQAIRVVNNVQEVIAVERLKVHDVVLVKTGDQIPVDGVILEGTSHIDEANLTGESRLISKKKDDMVYAGSISMDGILLVEVRKDPKETLMQKMIDLVHEAQANQMQSQSLIDRIEIYYVYVVLCIAALFMIAPLFTSLTWYESFYRGTIVLVVGSPCALVASITPAMLATLSNAARKRILIKGGKRLEVVPNVDLVVFDKTGTLTRGIPEVTAFEILNDGDEKWIRSMFYTIESHSNHVLAQAISNYFRKEELIKEVKPKEYPGRGLEVIYKGDTYQVGRFDHDEVSQMKPYLSEGSTIVSLIKNHKVCAFVVLEDVLREHVKETIANLKKMGIKSVLISGDQVYSVQKVAKELEIEEYVASAFPADKVKLIKSYQNEGHIVLMIGDGINDAPALATANLGVSMGSGTDVSLETSDIIFMNNDLSHIESTIKLAKRMRRIMIENIVFSVSVIILLMLTNIFGFMTLPIGVIAHEGSTILVILNSLRLLV